MLNRLQQMASKLTACVRRDRSERALEREMAAHLALMEDDFRRQGLSDAEARAAARRCFGGVEQAKEEYRDQRGFVWIEQLWQDVRHAAWGLWKSPGFSVVAILSLAFGIGVNTAIFTLVNGILIQKLNIPEPERVVLVKTHGKTWQSDALSYPQYVELQRQQSIFADTIAFSSNRAVLNSSDGEQQIDLELVTGNYFTFFHANPLIGRLLTAEDDAVEGAHAVCVLSYQAWRSRFGSDPGVLGRIVRINTYPVEVIGVAGPDFVGAELQSRYDVWIPSAMAEQITWNPRHSANSIWLTALGKLRSTLSLAGARARLRAASTGINDSLPKSGVNTDAIFDVVDGSKGADQVRTLLQRPLTVLMGAVGLVLLIACANLTNLLLARASERAQEFSVKLSLGISRLRLMRQLLLESALLTAVGGALALITAKVLLSVSLPFLNTGAGHNGLTALIDTPVLLFTFAVCTCISVLVGISPARTAMQINLVSTLKKATPRSLARRVLIVVQIALAIVLLFGASIFSHSLRKLKTVDLCFDIEHVTTITINFRGKTAFSGSQPLNNTLARTRSLPGVDSASLANPSMLSNYSMTSTVESDSKPNPMHKEVSAYFVFASPQNFATLRMPLLRGRDFAESDRKGSQPVAIINQRLASLLWPGQDALGKQMIGGWNSENPIVVGVVANSKYSNVRQELKPIVYEPLNQIPLMAASLEVRSQLPLRQVEQQVRKLVSSSAPEFQIADVSAMELLRDHGIAQDRLLTFLSVLFGLLGTSLALVGIYGLISYSVTRRTREIGIRMSIGAQRHEVLILFLREVLLLVSVGMLIGIPLALALARPLANFLYEVSPADPFGVASTLVLIATGALAASCIPARRATRVDPVVALRYE
jgi:predicted permease